MTCLGLLRGILAGYFSAMIRNMWRPGIGDPTAVGWIITMAYALAALLCLRTTLISWYQVSRSSTSRRRTLFWLVVTLFAFFLGVNKQLDLQTWVTEAGRIMAREQGWYEQRRIVQMWFVAGVALTGLGVLVACFWLGRSVLRQHPFTLLGIIFLACFVVIRAASMHHVDEVLGLRLGGLKIRWILELSGIVCLGFSAWNASNLLREGVFWEPPVDHS